MKRQSLDLKSEPRYVVGRNARILSSYLSIRGGRTCSRKDLNHEARDFASNACNLTICSTHHRHYTTRYCALSTISDFSIPGSCAKYHADPKPRAQLRSGTLLALGSKALLVWAASLKMSYRIRLRGYAALLHSSRASYSSATRSCALLYM